MFEQWSDKSNPQIAFAFYDNFIQVQWAYEDCRVLSTDKEQYMNFLVKRRKLMAQLIRKAYKKLSD